MNLILQLLVQGAISYHPGLSVQDRFWVSCMDGTSRFLQQYSAASSEKIADIARAHCDEMAQKPFATKKHSDFDSCWESVRLYADRFPKERAPRIQKAICGDV